MLDRTVIALMGCAAVSLISASLHAQEPEPATLAGTVVDAESGDPVAAARVRVEGPGREALTGPEGTFRLSDLPPAAHRVRVTRFGYRADERRVLLSAGAETRVQVALEPAAVELPSLEVRVPAPGLIGSGFFARMREGKGQFITRAEIEAREPVRLSQMLKPLSGVHVDFRPRRGWNVRMFDREGTGLWCRPVLVVNAQVVPNRSVGGMWTLDRLDPAEIEAAEVYLSSADIPKLRAYLRPAEEYDPRGERTVFSPPDMDPSRPGVQEPEAGSLVQVGLSPRRSSLEFFNADCGAILVWTRDAVLR